MHMLRCDLTYYSPCMGRDMHMVCYGHYGLPILAFPCQGSGANNLEDYGLIGEISDYIDQGKIKVYVVDSMDDLTLSGGDDLGNRSYWMEQYYHAIVDEVLPRLIDHCGGQQFPILFGMSGGATHAAAIFFRRPDLFGGILGLSGVYDTSVYFGGWCDDRLYENSPLGFLKNMDPRHFYIDLYNHKKIILCVGQGPWENETLHDTRAMDAVFHEKGIHAWVDYWGYDAAHDWPWWKKQARYFLPKFFEN